MIIRKYVSGYVLEEKHAEEIAMDACARIQVALGNMMGICLTAQIDSALGRLEKKYKQKGLKKVIFRMRIEVKDVN